jgi:hypothetical protein
LIDPVVSGNRTVNEDGIGSMQFGAVKAELDGSIELFGAIKGARVFVCGR